MFVPEPASIDPSTRRILGGTDKCAHLIFRNSSRARDSCQYQFSADYTIFMFGFGSDGWGEFDYDYEVAALMYAMSGIAVI